MGIANHVARASSTMEIVMLSSILEDLWTPLFTWSVQLRLLLLWASCWSRPKRPCLQMSRKSWAATPTRWRSHLWLLVVCGLYASWNIALSVFHKNRCHINHHLYLWESTLLFTPAKRFNDFHELSTRRQRNETWVHCFRSRNSTVLIKWIVKKWPAWQWYLYRRPLDDYSRLLQHGHSSRFKRPQICCRHVNYLKYSLPLIS